MSEADRIAVITGGTGGLGGAVTRAYLDRGGPVVVTYIIDAEADQMRRDSPEIGGRLTLEKIDVTDPAAVGKLVRATTERYGQIDYLVNLVGGWMGGPRVWETSDADFERMLTMNLRTAFVCCRAVLPGMVERNFGRVVNVSSRTARLVGLGQAPYAVSKAGIITLTETLALEVQDSDINVNCIMPSTIDTPANRQAMPGSDFSRWVKPAQLASVISWLTTPGAAAINGAAIPVYGRA